MIDPLYVLLEDGHYAGAGSEERMTDFQRPPNDNHNPRHARAVANSLQLADEAASRGDYAEAVAWVDTVIAIGERLPPDVHQSRQAWLRQMADGQPEAGSVDGSKRRRLAE